VGEAAERPDVAADSLETVRRVVREELTRSSEVQREWLLRAGRGVAALYGASLVVYLASVFLALMLVYILGALIEPWIGAAVVGGVLLVGSVVAMRAARRYFERMVHGE
jgi:Flp pilus assembly protein TadB